MINKSLVISFLFFTILTSPTTNTYALPIGWSTSTINGMIVVSDTTNDLQWLSPIFSTDISYNTMLNNLVDSTSIYYGFEYASKSQLESLYTAYDLVIGNTWKPENFTPGTQFQNDFGITHYEPYKTSTLGIINDPLSEFAQYAGDVATLTDSPYYPSSLHYIGLATTDAFFLIPIHLQVEVHI